MGRHLPRSLPFVVILSAACTAGPRGSEGPAASRPERPSEPATAKAEPAKTPSDRTASRLERPSEPVKVGAEAPAFELRDLDGRIHRLADYAGKIVVLEWFNPACPFIQYAHTKGPLRDLARSIAGDDLVYLAINPGAPGKQGADVETNRQAVARFGLAHPVLLDPQGVVGRAYGAAKTPHMFVIDRAGTLVYAGALDNAPMGEVDGDGPHVVYVRQAVEALRAGTQVPRPETPPYGCSVKYGS